MKQSAMQKLLEEVILEREKSISVEFRDALDFVITAIETDYKEMEKQQIIDACNQEECFGSYGYGIHEDITKGEEYYNVTFNKQVK